MAAFCGAAAVGLLGGMIGLSAVRSFGCRC
jgi:hypothetical protein